MLLSFEQLSINIVVWAYRFNGAKTQSPFPTDSARQYFYINQTHKVALIQTQYTCTETESVHFIPF